MDGFLLLLALRADRDPLDIMRGFRKDFEAFLRKPLGRKKKGEKK